MLPAWAYLPAMYGAFLKPKCLRPDGQRLKVPHMGWNEVCSKSRMRCGLASPIRHAFILCIVIVCNRPIVRW
jgi:hypothetical protein